MNLKDFVNLYDDTYLEFDGAFKYQCQDLAKAWEAENGWPIIMGNAKEVINNADKSFYEVVQSPQEGDLVVWGMQPYGHIAVFVKYEGSGFISFDQNYPVGTPCHLQRHNFTSTIIGYLRPKGVDMGFSEEHMKAVVSETLRKSSSLWFAERPDKDVQVDINSAFGEIKKGSIDSVANVIQNYSEAKDNQWIKDGTEVEYSKDYKEEYSQEVMKNNELQREIDVLKEFSKKDKENFDKWRKESKECPDKLVQCEKVLEGKPVSRWWYLKKFLNLV